MLPRRHRDRDRAAGTRAVHVQWGVADDRDALERELATRDDARALAGDSGQAAAIHVVRAEGAHAEQRPQSRGRQLEPSAGLDVAGEQADERVVARGQRADDVGDAGQNLHARAVADDPAQLLEVRGVKPVEPARDCGLIEAGTAQQVPHDARIGLAAEVVGLDGAGGAVRGVERAAEGGTAGAARRHQRAVDVEEEEPHVRARGDVGARSRRAALRRRRRPPRPSSSGRA